MAWVWQARQAQCGLQPRWARWDTLALAAALLGGCAPVVQNDTAMLPQRVYVTDPISGTITRLDATSARALGPPLPAGPAAWLMTPGVDGSVLVAGAGAAHRDEITHVARAGGRWEARVMHLGAGAGGVQLAGDGGRFAAVAYRVRAAEGTPAAASLCRLALVDMRAGRIERTHALCAAEEEIRSVALRNDAAGPVVYLAVWRHGGYGDVASVQSWTGSGRILALDALSGEALGVFPLSGAPGQLVLGAAEDGGARLYCTEGVGAGGRGDDGRGEYVAAERWRILRLDPLTLEPEREHWLDSPPVWLGISPSGRDGYALDATSSPGMGTWLLHLDLATDQVRRLARVPSASVGGLAITHDRIYVPDTMDGRVLVIDRRRGWTLGKVRVGTRPLGVLLVHGG